MQHDSPKPKAQHGGARPGAGRPKNPPILSSIPGGDDAMQFLKAAMADTSIDMKLRLDAAKALVGYQHQKPGEVGKKEQQQEQAKKAATGRFAAGAPPLRAVR